MTLAPRWLQELSDHSPKGLSSLSPACTGRRSLSQGRGQASDPGWWEAKLLCTWGLGLNPKSPTTSNFLAATWLMF